MTKDEYLPICSNPIARKVLCITTGEAHNTCILFLLTEKTRKYQKL